MNAWEQVEMDDRISAEIQRQRAEQHEKCMTDPLGTAQDMLSWINSGDPDRRDTAMALQAIGLALCDIAVTLRRIKDVPR